jgi:hypothetical protein
MTDKTTVEETGKPAIGEDWKLDIIKGTFNFIGEHPDSTIADIHDGFVAKTGLRKDSTQWIVETLTKFDLTKVSVSDRRKHIKLGFETKQAANAAFTKVFGNVKAWKPTEVEGESKEVEPASTEA